MISPSTSHRLEFKTDSAVAKNESLGIFLNATERNHMETMALESKRPDELTSIEKSKHLQEKLESLTVSVDLLLHNISSLNLEKRVKDLEEAFDFLIKILEKKKAKKSQQAERSELPTRKLDWF